MIEIINQIKNEEEALVIFTTFGFSVKDWPFISKIGSALELLSSDLMMKFLSQKMLENKKRFSRLNNFRLIMDQFYQSDGFLLTPIHHARSKLFGVKDAPLAFFGRFKQAFLEREPKVAIVGSRQASELALALTRNLSRCLAEKKIVVVSGGARGVDLTAHLEALKAGGSTIVISGEVCKPSVSGEFMYSFGSRLQNVMVIYPYGPFICQGKYMFVERNRFVAVLAKAVVVVQGKMLSGTLHTAEFARELGVSVFAIPGAINDPLAHVPNRLLESERALALVNFEQFASAMMTKAPKPSKIPPIQLKEPTKMQANRADLPHILQVLSEYGNTLNFDELMSLTNCPRAILQRELLDYELAGRIKKCGAQFVLTEQ